MYVLLIKNHRGKNFVSHSNLSIKKKVVKKFPKFCQEISSTWRKSFCSPPKVLSVVASQFILCNEYIKIDNDTIYYCYFSQKNLTHIGDLFENNGKMRSCEDLRAKLGLGDNEKFYWRQTVHAIPRAWKEMFLECGNNISGLIIN